MILFILGMLGVTDTIAETIDDYVAIAARHAQAALGAARVAIVDQTFSTIQDRAAQQAVSLAIAPSSVIVSFRTPDDTASCPARSLGCLAVVTVPYDFTAITPVIGNIVGPISMSSTSKVPIERTFP